MSDERLSKWKTIRPDILWCSLPASDEDHALVAWPNMQISQAVSQECHDAFDGCILDRARETHFFGCILNARTQQVDAIYGVHKDDMSKTFFMSAKVVDPSDYELSRSTETCAGASTVLGYNL